MSTHTRALRASSIRDHWVTEVDLGLITQLVGTPVFVYNEPQLERNIGRVRTAAAAVGLERHLRLWLPFFPNANPLLLRALRSLPGVGLLLQIPSEHEILTLYGFDRFIVSPGHVSDAEVRHWARLGYPTFLSSIEEICVWLAENDGPVSVRIDSLDSGKPGLKLGEIAQLKNLLDTSGRMLHSVEGYCGSSRSVSEMVDNMARLFAVLGEHSLTVHAIDFAGGQSFDYGAWLESEKHFDWRTYLTELKRLAEYHQVAPNVEFWFEPARDLLADVAVLLLQVERPLISNSVGSIVVTNGSRMLMPSAQQRDRRHNVVFLNEEMLPLDAVSEVGKGRWAAIRGRTILRHDYILPGEYRVPVGVDSANHMLILDVGAYCATQHMEFLNVPPAPEVLVDRDGTASLITDRGGALDKWRHLLPEPKELRWMR